MSTAANATVKKADGTTDITYTVVAASGGDKSPAVFRSLTVGAASAHHPELRIQSRFNGTNTARRVDGVFTYPSLATGSDGKVTVVDRFNLTFSGLVPVGMPDTEIAEAAAQSCNLMAHAMVKDSLKTGFAPV